MAILDIHFNHNKICHRNSLVISVMVRRHSIRLGQDLGSNMNGILLILILAVAGFLQDI